MIEVYRNPYFSVEYDRDYFSLTFPTPRVIIVPIIANDHLLMVMTNRPIIGRPALEFPVGGANVGESLESCAVRELREETGVRITDTSRLVQLPSIYPMPARMKDKTHLFYVQLTQPEFESRTTHDREIDCVKDFSHREVMEMAISGDFFTSTHISAFFIYLAGASKISLAEEGEIGDLNPCPTS